jgi:hypothetical protein
LYEHGLLEFVQQNQPENNDLPNYPSGIPDQLIIQEEQKIEDHNSPKLSDPEPPFP